MTERAAAIAPLVQACRVTLDRAQNRPPTRKVSIKTMLTHRRQGVYARCTSAAARSGLPQAGAPER